MRETHTAPRTGKQALADTATHAPDQRQPVRYYEVELLSPWKMLLEEVPLALPVFATSSKLSFAELPVEFKIDQTLKQQLA